MRKALYILLLVALTACATGAWGAPPKREPHIGYVFPAGGQHGSTYEVTVGGQFLIGVSDVYVSGEGVHAEVIKHYRLRRFFPAEQRQELLRQVQEQLEKHLADVPERERPPGLRALMRARGGRANRNATAKGNAAEMAPAELPDHPLLRNLEAKSLKELIHISNEFLNPKNLLKRQLNTQIGEMVLIKVTIDRDAPPGERELRLRSLLGLTNPMCFQVGTLPEVREQEPNDPNTLPFLPAEQPLELPVLLNGQIMPGDVDRFRFRAKEGQQLVIETQARQLVPFLADAVPGWFQPTLTLYDAQGEEVAFADDYRFRPDPVLSYRILRDGEYELEIRDSIYRGREDFVYRIAIGELPFITQAFPLGTRAGETTAAAVEGWNLPADRLPLDTSEGNEGIRQAAMNQNACASNDVTYAVDALPESNEAEPNDEAQHAQRVTLPRIVNGRIDGPGDVDVFRFDGRAGDKVALEVSARRLQSPLDSLLRLMDASGRVLEWNDDYVQQKDDYLHTDMGILTHHADSYLTARLPESGPYYVRLSDAQNHGGEAYGYRLRIAPPLPDFSLYMSPASLTVPAGRLVPFTVHVLRKDGFDGEIEVTLKDAPAGFVLSGGRIPAGRDCIRMTLAAPRMPLDEPLALQLEGRARINGQEICRPVVPSDDVMQAFLYRHLVPAQKLMVAVTRNRWMPPIELDTRDAVRIPEGGTAPVKIRTPRRPRQQVKLEIDEPAEGISIRHIKFLEDGLAFQLKAEGETAKAGYTDNLIVEIFVKARNNEGNKEGGTRPNQQEWISIGILPAIPFTIVAK
jgi:hypothetical protein